jgi:membrane associated rhomboid family serine protease
MLEDRDYMRQPEYPGLRWSVTSMLLVAFTVVFILEVLVSPFPGRLVPNNQFVYDHFALSLYGISHGWVWQLLTYQFMHGGLMHLFGNCLAIYFFGREMEMILGWRKYLVLFFGSGVVGGMFQMLAAFLWRNYFDVPVVGASAGAFGLVAAFATLFPDRELYLLLFYVIPIRLRARTLLVISAVLALLGFMFSESVLGGNIAHVAHLGGMLTGIFYVRQVMQGRWFHFHFRNPLRRSRPRPMVTAQAGGKKSWGGSPDLNVEDSDESFIKNEVDPILDKITAHGIHSLTARERKILENARKKMSRS